MSSQRRLLQGEGHHVLGAIFVSGVAARIDCQKWKTMLVLVVIFGSSSGVFRLGNSLPLAFAFPEIIRGLFRGAVDFPRRPV